jgi:hypothetical protein
MSALSHQNVDALILSFAKMQWLKVAMIISKVVDECRRRGVDINCHDIARRICALVEGGQLEAQGDLSLWRRSEVKLPD